MDVRPLGGRDRGWLTELMRREWGLPVVSISGVYAHPGDLRGFIAEEDGRPLGAITYQLTAGECEVVTLNSLRRNQGVGSALLNRVRLIADQQGLRLWLITTDGNTEAIRFYENRGMTRLAVHKDFIDVVRVHKTGSSGEAKGGDYRDAIEFTFEKPLRESTAAP
jgi:GNAT superfamily N-acetyltransferase